MTHKVFWTDPYLACLDTEITRVDGDTVTVDATIFYAFSGGQESDRGTLGGRPVLEARKEGKEIFYTLAPGHGLQSGDPVRIDIDWQRRYRLMRLHFAAEIVLELVYRKLDYPSKVGAHIAEDKARIDFEWDENISSFFPGILSTVQQIVADDRPITSAFADEANEERYWEIPDFGRVPCGGTHLRRTGEIGDVVLKRKNPGKGKERIEIRLVDP